MATSSVRSILLVEDDADMQLLVRLSLQPDPRIDIVAYATTAEAAIELADEHQPDLILLDHGLAGDLDGLNAAPLFKRRAPWAKVVLLSAVDLHRDAAFEPAIDQFVRKDRVRDLLTITQHLLGLDAPLGCDA